jgi:drug/metabolite transporter (DMT)-like permease
MDWLHLPWRHRVRLGAELAVDEDIAARLATAVRPRSRRGDRISYSRCNRLGRHQSLKVRRETIPRLLFASFTNVFAWMGFSTVAMKFVTVGEGALIIYTMPIWAMLFAWPVLHMRPTVRDVIALVLGIAGVALLLGANGFAFNTSSSALSFRSHARCCSHSVMS